MRFNYLKLRLPISRFSMRISPVYNNNIVVNCSKPDRTRFNKNQGADSFVSFTGGECGKFGSISDKDLENICKLIKSSDEARLDGSIQGVYRFGDFMVKAPECDAHSAPIKEFYALMRLNSQKGTVGVAPQPAVVSMYSKRNFVVEEFVQGEHAELFPFKIKDVDNIFDTLVNMDKAGVVNQDLSPSNILFTPDKRQRIVDFDTFSFISEEGRVMHSSRTPSVFFSQRIPSSKLVKTSFMKKSGTKYPTARKIKPQEMFAKSFAYERRIPAGLEDLDYIRAMSDNPHINMPSNLSSYEARTIYKRIVDSDVENPVEFLKQYLLRKSEYHSRMQEYLEGMKIPEEIMEYEKGRLSFNEAQARLKRATFYEGFLARIYRENAQDQYFAKLEAAKMQLGALLYDDNLSKHATNKSQIHDAYEKLIKIITDGISSFDDPDRSLYLKTELKRYTEAFGNTDFSITTSRQKVLDSLDIVANWFGDKGVDLKSFQASKDTIKETAIKSVAKYIKENKGNNIPEEVALAEERKIAEAAIRSCFEKVLEGRVPKSRVDKGIAILVEEAIQDAQQGRFQDPVTKIWYKSGETAKSGIKQKIMEEQAAARQAAKLASETTASAHIEEKLGQYARTYQAETFAKNGGRLLAATGALIAFGGLVFYNVKKYKEAQREKELQNIIPQKKEISVMDLVSSTENNPFKNFII